MNHLGNDIVDLAVPEAQGKNQRFMQKILTNDEMQMVLESGDPNFFLWMFWAAKESAYKALSKSMPGISFLPKRYSVLLNQGTNEGRVIAPEGRVSLWLEVNKDWIYCVCTTADAVDFNVINSKIEQMDQSFFENDGTCPQNKESNFVRSAARQGLAKYLGVNSDNIEIVRLALPDGKLQPPIVKINGKSTGIDISLSHDGRFAAYCFCLGKEFYI